MSTKSLLVPTDFTAVAHVALEHAAKLAETIGSEVVLLHVVGNATEVEKAKEQLVEEAKIITESNSEVVVRTTVRIGSIFEDIAETAAEESAELIIMGTHGAKGWQKLTGSYALKVITSSSVPFIVVQNKGIKDSGYDDIVVPMDMGNETKQKLEVVANMAHYFNSRVHVFVERNESETAKVKGNVLFAHKYLTEHKVKHDTKVAEKSGDFDGQVLAYAKEVDADLIVIMNTASGGMFGGRHEQNMITNEDELPVMTVNPVNVSGAGTIFTR